MRRGIRNKMVDFIIYIINENKRKKIKIAAAKWIKDDRRRDFEIYCATHPDNPKTRNSKMFRLLLKRFNRAIINEDKINRR